MGGFFKDSERYTVILSRFGRAVKTSSTKRVTYDTTDSHVRLDGGLLDPISSSLSFSTDEKSLKISIISV